MSFMWASLRPRRFSGPPGDPKPGQFVKTVSVKGGLFQVRSYLSSWLAQLPRGWLSCQLAKILYVKGFSFQKIEEATTNDDSFVHPLVCLLICGVTPMQGQQRAHGAQSRQERGARLPLQI